MASEHVHPPTADSPVGYGQFLLDGSWLPRFAAPPLRVRPTGLWSSWHDGEAALRSGAHEENSEGPWQGPGKDLKGLEVQFRTTVAETHVWKLRTGKHLGISNIHSSMFTQDLSVIISVLIPKKCKSDSMGVVVYPLSNYSTSPRLFSSKTWYRRRVQTREHQTEFGLRTNRTDLSIFYLKKNKLSCFVSILRHPCSTYIDAPGDVSLS